jgi:uncharacterized protein (TIGR02466 family)
MSEDQPPALDKSAAEDPKYQVLHAFPTMIVQREWSDVDDLNKELTAALAKRRDADPGGIQRSNQGGTWHSDTELLQWCDAAGQRLGQMFAKTFGALADAHGGTEGGEYKLNLSAWAMLAGDRGYATVHTHPNCHWAGVYYVDVGPANKTGGEAGDATKSETQKDLGGQIEFVDTRAVGQTNIAGLITSPALRLEPKPGLMVVFPSWLPHFVHPIKGEGTRISISCNATMEYIRPDTAKA